MSAENDPSNKAEELKGRAKEAAGDLTDDQDLKNEGSSDRLKAKAKDKVDKASDKLKDKLD